LPTFVKKLLGSIEYTQAWLRGDESIDGDHVHEGLRLADGSGWVGIGDTNINGESDKPTQVKVTKIQSIFSFLLTKADMVHQLERQ
jgi:hypothetical protein